MECPKCKKNECEVKTSHSEKNPNRNYYNCPDCGFAGWAEKEEKPEPVKSNGYNDAKEKEIQANQKMAAQRNATAITVAKIESSHFELDEIEDETKLADKYLEWLKK